MARSGRDQLPGSNEIITWMTDDGECRYIATNENGMNVAVDIPNDSEWGNNVQAVLKGTHPAVKDVQHIKHARKPREFVCPATELACIDPRCTRKECENAKDAERNYEVFIEKDLERLIRHGRVDAWLKKNKIDL